MEELLKKLSTWLHVVYTPLWVYIIAIVVYFSCFLHKEQYSGNAIRLFPIGLCLQFGSSTFYSIFAASCVSITLGTITLLDLMMYPPTSSQQVVNRPLLSMVLFMPIGILLVVGLNLQSTFPFATVLVHTVQLSCSTACVMNFFRRVCPSTFSDLVCGSFCVMMYSGLALASIGFGYDVNSNVFVWMVIVLAFLCAILLLFMLYTFVKDEAALSFISKASWERSIFMAMLVSYGVLLSLTLICTGRHMFDIRNIDANDSNLIYWSGVLFAYGVLLITRFYDNRDRITTEQRIGIQLSAEASANQVNSLMLRYISHEIRSPLTVVTSSLQFLLEDGAGYEMSRSTFCENMKEAIRGCEAAITVASEILTFEAIKDGKFPVMCELVPFVDTIKSIVNHCKGVVVAKQIDLTIENLIPENDNVEYFAYFDCPKMEQVLRNIITNAAKFTPNQGKIIVSLGYEEVVPVRASHRVVPALEGAFKTGKVIIQVTDNGCGMTADNMHQEALRSVCAV